MIELRPFQRRFIKAATAPGIDTAALSLPRGTAKAPWPAISLRACSTPPMRYSGPKPSRSCAPERRTGENLLQVRPRGLGADRGVSVSRQPYAHRDHAQEDQHAAAGDIEQRKTAMGLVGTPWVIADEPGAWETNGGRCCMTRL